MRYLSFTIRNYRAITGPLTVELEKRSLIPIIGVNESGKTTILHAIFAFDADNDDLNDDGRHLRDTSNLYRTNPPTAQISARITISEAELHKCLNDLIAENPEPALKSWGSALIKKRSLPTTVEITRHLLEESIYTIETVPLKHSTYGPLLAEAIVRRAPYILFFDDFRDKVEELIAIPQTQTPTTGWLAIMERLFKRTEKSLSVFQLAKMEERQRKSVLAKVTRHLNETLTKEWANFRLDDRDALELSIDYVTKSGANGTTYHLKLDIVETDANGDKHYFFVSDRSKGFFWFFNFVMKLEFNPKVISDFDTNTVYLLDEPGSYLHASAQSKLCRKLRRLSEGNKVIYCTHSHYLLDPSHIPFATIRIADKDANGSVTISSLFEHKGTMRDRRSAFQPVIDALQIKPFVLDLTAENIVVVEGICDYYAFEMFKGARQLAFLPSTGADSIKYYVSLLIAWQANFWALWDNDEKGRENKTTATDQFGDEIAGRRFRLLPLPEGHSKRILQNLFDGSDLSLIRERLGLSTEVSFDKAIAALFYSSDRADILRSLSQATRDSFAFALDSLEIDRG